MTIQSSEADMGYIRDFVQKIAEALVSATELPKQIASIQASMDTLNHDLERTKARNIELDTMLADTRRQRDEAEQALSQVKAQLSDTSRSLEQATNDTNGLKAQVEHFRSELEKAKTERDEYGMRHMETEDRAREAEAKLAKLADALGLPKAQPKPDPVPVAKAPEPTPQPVATPEVVPFQSWANPPQPEAQSAPPEPTQPEAAPAPTRVYEGQFGFNELSHSTEQWDNVTQRYYRTA